METSVWGLLTLGLGFRERRGGQEEEDQFADLFRIVYGLM